MSAPTLEQRPTCERCRRPLSVCYCAHLTRLETRTRVVFLQHPREKNVGIGTARMASLCLVGSELHVGVRWSGSPALESALSDPSRPAALLYPGPTATDLAGHPPPGPITLIVVDGTWAHARKIVKENPELQALPRYTFVPPRPSEYRIRKEPDAAYLSTIESLAHVLGVLEGDPERFEVLRAPFRAMVEAQLAHARTSTGSRHKKSVRLGARSKRGRVPRVFRERAADLVCVVAEANAWPFGTVERERGDPGDLVHCVACRPSTGERLEMFVAPRRALSPATAFHIEVPDDRVLGGEPAAKFRARWQAFIRPTDVLCAWGTHSLRLLQAVEAELPADRVDLRLVARVLRSRRVGAIETFRAELPPALAWPTLEGAPAHLGRAGRRLALMLEIVRHFVEEAATPPAPRQPRGSAASVDSPAEPR